MYACIVACTVYFVYMFGRDFSPPPGPCPCCPSGFLYICESETSQMKWQVSIYFEIFFLVGMKSKTHEKYLKQISSTWQCFIHDFGAKFPCISSCFYLFDLTQREKNGFHVCIFAGTYCQSSPPSSSSQVAEDVADSLRCIAGGFGTATSTTCWFRCVSETKESWSCHLALLAKELTFCFLRMQKG